MSDYETGGVTQAQYDALRSRLAEAEKRAEKAEADCRDHESARATQAQAMVETRRFLEGVEKERDALAATIGEIGEFADRYARPLVDGLRQLGEAGAVAELLDSAVDSVLELAAQVKDLASSHSRGPLARYRAKVLEEARRLFQEVVARDGTTAMFDAELGRMAGESSTLPTNALSRYRAEVLGEAVEVAKTIRESCQTQLAGYMCGRIETHLRRMAGETGEWSREIGPDGEQIRHDGEEGK